MFKSATLQAMIERLFLAVMLDLGIVAVLLLALEWCMHP